MRDTATQPPDASLPLEYAQADPRPEWARRSEFWGAIGTVALLMIGVPGLYVAGALDITTVNQLGRFLCFAIVAIGIDLVWGYTGMLSLCQAMFFCFGGYAIGMHMALHGPLDGDGIPRALFVVTSEVEGFQLPAFWKPFQTLSAAMFLAMFLPGVVAFVFGYFAFRSRIRGVYFSIITQATVWAAVLIFRRNETRLCGTNGLTNFVSLAGFNLNDPNVKLGLYLLTALTLIAVYLACKHVVASRLGRLLVATRDNESRLRFAGYQPVKLKLFAFTAGAVIAGIGGMLYTPQNGIITPYKMEPIESIIMVVWVAVGGRGTLVGAVVGAILVNYLQSFLTTKFPAAWMFILGGMYIAVTLAMPDGIVGLWKKYTTREVGPADGAAAAESSPTGAPPPSAASQGPLPNVGNMLREGAVR